MKNLSNFRFCFVPILLFSASCYKKSESAPVKPVPAAKAPPAIVQPPVANVPVPAPIPISKSPQDEEDKAFFLREIERLKKANPTTDLEQAWQARDYRFTGIYGYALGVPGVKADLRDLAVERYGVKPILRTNDFIRGPEQSEFQRLATQYAKIYNQLLWNKLRMLNGNTGATETGQSKYSKAR